MGFRKGKLRAKGVGARHKKGCRLINKFEEGLLNTIYSVRHSVICPRIHFPFSRMFARSPAFEISTRYDIPKALERMLRPNTSDILDQHTICQAPPFV